MKNILARSLFSILFTMNTAYAATSFRIESFKGQVHNYGTADLSKVTGSVFWQCTSRSILVPGWPKSCGDGETFFNVNSDGSFVVPKMWVKHGNKSNALQIRFYYDGYKNSYGLESLWGSSTNVPYDNEKIQALVKDISIYSFGGGAVSYVMESGRDGAEWLATDGRETRLGIGVRFPGELDRQASEAHGFPIGETAMDLPNKFNGGHFFVIGDLGANPKYTITTQIKNEAHGEKAKYFIISDKLIGEFVWNSEIASEALTVTVDDAKFKTNIDRSIDGSFYSHIAVNDGKYEFRNWGKSVLSCENGVVVGNYQTTLWNDQARRSDKFSVPMTGTCKDDFANISFSLNGEQYLIKVEVVTYRDGVKIPSGITVVGDHRKFSWPDEAKIFNQRTGSQVGEYKLEACLYRSCEQYE